ncbi:MAG: hypothetical protein J6N51_14775 [Selenomonas sp.]|nr:hypothetical protein [Selenomonas sp.]
MIKCERTYPAPESLAKRQAYNEADVISRLKAIFYDKCYICGLKGLQDGVVEHLVSHKGNDDLKYDWNNLFWSCHHCNQWKNKRGFETDVLDCCHQNPEQHIMCIYDPRGNRVIVKPRDTEQSSVITARLIANVFNEPNTGIRINASSQRMQDLRREWNVFLKLLADYRKEKSAHRKRLIRARLSRTSAFAAFKRDYIREHQSEYKEFLEFVS